MMQVSEAGRKRRPRRDYWFWHMSARSTRFGSPLVLSRVHWVEPKLVADDPYLTGQRQAQEPSNNGSIEIRAFVVVSFLALGFAVIEGSSASAQTAEQQCSHEWLALKSSGNQGWTEQGFMAACKNHHTFAAAPSGLGPAEPTATQVSATGKSSSQCDAEYAANKAAIKAPGQTKRAFVAACRHGQ
jgi:hypothetical protein